jgi:transposase-like protein
MRGLLQQQRKAPNTESPTVPATAFAQNDAAAATMQWRRVADQLRPKLAKLAALMDEAESDALAHMSFPPQHRAKIHSTNPLERLNGEIKRGTRSSASFPTTPRSPASSVPSCLN